MLKRTITLIITYISFSINAMAATYERMQEDAVSSRSFSSVLSTLWNLVISPKFVIPEFRPIIYVPDINTQWQATLDRKLGLMYMDGDKVPKDINEGLRLLNEAAQLGQGDACRALDGIFRYGKYNVPINLELAETYRQNIKWYVPGESLIPEDVPAASAAEEEAERRPSGDSDGATTLSTHSTREAASGLRHRGP